ncbi:MAG: tRNA lysidine(34) synthetase TilS [Bacteroidaceae bacterium]|nr:tRNA lysidine(34) synthetase TilS [Bacteroidaceae bacterium]
MNRPTDILEIISQFIQDKHLMNPDDHIVVALSGGADSVFLLHSLISIGYHCEAAHCNFHLRGEESNRDEEFVKSLCKRLNTKLHTISFDTETYAKQKGISIEMAARELRYKWFEKIRKESNSQYIAVAHHRDDNIETVLLNMLRSTGLKGMRGIQPKNGHIVRPLLCISRKDILHHLKSMGETYVNDSTNFETIYKRNKIRLELMPLLRTINPAADQTLSATIDNLDEAFKVYDDNMKRLTSYCSHKEGNTLYINIKNVSDCCSHISVAHELLSPMGFNRCQIDELLAGTKVGSKFETSSHTLIVDRNEWIVAPKDEEPFEETLLCDFKDIRCEEKEAKGIEFDSNPKVAYIDIEKIKGNLKVRTAREGDSFQPYGMKGRKLLSDFLTDKKLSRKDKERQLVVCDDNDIVWVVGLRSSDKYKVDKSSKRILILSVE